MPDVGALKQVIASNWVDTKRERKRVANYNEAEYFKQVGAWRGGEHLRRVGGQGRKGRASMWGRWGKARQGRE